MTSVLQIFSLKLIGLTFSQLFSLLGEFQVFNWKIKNIIKCPLIVNKLKGFFSSVVYNYLPIYFKVSVLINGSKQIKMIMNLSKEMTQLAVSNCNHCQSSSVLKREILTSALELTFLAPDDSFIFQCNIGN